MNRITLAGVIVIGVLVLVAIIGGFWLHLNRPDATATFVAQSVQLIGLVTLAAGVFASLNKIQGQTNGTLSALREQNEHLRSELSSTRELHAAATGTVPASNALQTPAVIPPTPMVIPPAQAVQPDVGDAD
jgi:hypothetical protein